MKIFITYSFLLFISLIYGKKESCIVKGSIANYANQPLSLYQCYGDSLIFIDSVKTDEKGKFVFNQFSTNGIYRINLQRNQWFYLLSGFGKRAVNEVEIKTVCRSDVFNNWASDSLQVILSEENKMFYEFQRAQKQITVSSYVIKEIMRLYPLQDPFHKVIEKEYLQRYKTMDDLFKEVNKKSPNSLSAKIINSYYQPINPDWKEPDNWRDSIIAAHYFNYFNPADSFYLNTNILPEKIDNYFNLFSFLMRVNRETRSDYEKHIIKAAHEFLKHTVSNDAVHEFCLQYILKKSDNEKMYDALFSVYDKWVYRAMAGDCEQTSPSLNKWREKVSVLRNIQPGSIAPDFEIYPACPVAKRTGVESINYSTGVEKGKLSLSSLQNDYTLLLFWATWCPHCTLEVPEIKKTTDDFNSKQEAGYRLPDSGYQKLVTVAVSLDTDRDQWQKFVTEKNLLSFLNYSELKGWQSEVVKKYNVYATPTLFLLDKDKKIIAKPENVQQLNNALMINTE